MTNENLKKRFYFLISALIFIAISVSAQTGGNFTVTQSVVAGGGQNSAS